MDGEFDEFGNYIGPSEDSNGYSHDQQGPSTDREAELSNGENELKENGNELAPMDLDQRQKGIIAFSV
jgi:hypothetical protein